ncbi:hypothetical protein [Streptomyces sp. NPDC048428]|uniref:hypothetical protein n=1 Tax=Streptomyces sp. NPDC048428 TaxID=3154503 RepID=UPI003415757E
MRATTCGRPGVWAVCSHRADPSQEKRTSSAILSPGGEIAALGPHIVFHAGSMKLVVQHIINDC